MRVEIVRAQGQKDIATVCRKRCAHTRTKWRPTHSGRTCSLACTLSVTLSSLSLFCAGNHFVCVPAKKGRQSRRRVLWASAPPPAVWDWMSCDCCCCCCCCLGGCFPATLNLKILFEFSRKKESNKNARKWRQGKQTYKNGRNHQCVCGLEGGEWERERERARGLTDS